MALENVINEIISQAEKQKQEIIEQGKQEAWKMLDEAANRAKQRKKFFDGETAKIVDEAKRMELSSTNIQARKLLLDAKRGVLNELYTKLEEKIGEMDARTRKELLHRFVEKAKEEMPDAKFAYCGSKDKEHINGLQLKGVIACLGGVIVENADGTVRINYTFDVLLEQVKEAHLNEIAKKIFS